MELSNLTIEQLQEMRKKIMNSCYHWISCQDGSYEMALHYAGLTNVDKEIKLREEQNIQNQE
jgi:hypothetical protein